MSFPTTICNSHGNRGSIWGSECLNIYYIFLTLHTFEGAKYGIWECCKTPFGVEIAPRFHELTAYGVKPTNFVSAKTTFYTLRGACNITSFGVEITPIILPLYLNVTSSIKQFRCHIHWLLMGYCCKGKHRPQGSMDILHNKFRKERTSPLILMKLNFILYFILFYLL